MAKGLAIVTGSSGLIGSESVSFLIEKGFDVLGIDNDMRKYFFGKEASTKWMMSRLLKEYPKRYKHYDVDIRNFDKVSKIFKNGRPDLVVHAAAQPSHDWAAKEPFTDFTVNANGTLNLLEATRQFAPETVFIYTSTNKVYGDTPNRLPLVELEKRWELAKDHPYYDGIDETMSIDDSLHSLFGASKAAADILVQEYGRYFNISTACLRGGCLTGPAHSGTRLHGFLSYLVRCAITGVTYHIYGYKGKQVRDNIHSYDFVNTIFHFYQNPKVAAVYNMGGSRYSNCSILEAIDIIEQISGKKVNYVYEEQNRVGDHIWYISSVKRFMNEYPDWKYTYDIRKMIQEIYDVQKDLPLDQLMDKNIS
jgi:CDP-paratose 2-epimerase